MPVQLSEQHEGKILGLVAAGTILTASANDLPADLRPVGQPCVNDYSPSSPERQMP
jgi:hypothetical protein